MTITATQAKIGLSAIAALIAWLLGRKLLAPAPGRVSREIEIEADVFSPWFGYTDAERAAAEAAGARPNPAIDPAMREVIDRSNAILAGDDE